MQPMRVGSIFECFDFIWFLSIGWIFLKTLFRSTWSKIST